MDIRKKVNTLIRKYGTACPDRLAAALDIEIIYIDLGGDVYGSYVKYKRMKRIMLDVEHTPERLQPFVLAHELGHAVCTPDANTSWLTTYTLAINVDRVERRANEFAVNLLLNDEYIEEHREYSLYQLAAIRGVPENLVELRCFK